MRVEGGLGDGGRWMALEREAKRWAEIIDLQHGLVGWCEPGLAG